MCWSVTSQCLLVCLTSWGKVSIYEKIGLPVLARWQIQKAKKSQQSRTATVTVTE